MNTQQTEYNKKAALFEQYIYELIGDEGKVFYGNTCAEVKTALEGFAKGIEPNKVLGIFTRDGGKEGILFTTEGIIFFLPSLNCFSFRYSDVMLSYTHDIMDRKLFGKPRDEELALTLHLKDDSRLDFKPFLFDKTALHRFIEEMANLETALHSESA